MAADLDTPFHASQFATLTTRVQREIERRILSGEIKAGARIGEAAMAESLGVSRGPVREAMRWLAQAGLVELVANKGAIVRSLGLDEITHLYELRGAIFAMACAALARNRTEETLAFFRRNMAEMEAACACGDKEAYYRLNLAFHSEILKRCGNSRAAGVYEGVVKEMHLFRRRGLSIVPNIAASLREHGAIVDAVIAGDPDAARRAGLAHIDGGCRRFLGTLSGEGNEAAEEKDIRQSD